MISQQVRVQHVEVLAPESGGQDPAAANGQAPHVLLISIDSLRADHRNHGPGWVLPR